MSGRNNGLPDERNPNDGRPYYCTQCGCGWGEYMACEFTDCTLETRDEAATRQTAAKRHSQKVEARQ